MGVRTVMRRYPYGAGFGGQMGGQMGTYGGAFSPLSASSNLADTTRPHPYFAWLAQNPAEVYGPESYAKWAATVPAGVSIPPQPPARGVYPNDPTSPGYSGGGAPGGGGGGGGAPPPGAGGAPPPQGLPNDLNEALTRWGGSIVGDNGKVVTVNINGTKVYFDKSNGRQLTAQQAAALGAGTAAPPPPGSTAGAAASPAGGSGPTAGQTVTGKTQDGRTVTGQIVSTANGQTTVRWDDGTVSTYDSGGNLLSSTPPAGAGGAAPAAGGTAGAAPAGGGLPATSTTGDVYSGSTQDQYAVPPAPSVPPVEPAMTSGGYPVTGTPSGSGGTLDAGSVAPSINPQNTILPPPPTNGTIDPGFTMPPAPAPVVPGYVPPSTNPLNTVLPPPPTNGTFDPGFTVAPAPAPVAPAPYVAPPPPPPPTSSYIDPGYTAPSTQQMTYVNAQGQSVTLEQLLAQSFGAAATTPPPTTNYTIPPQYSTQIAPTVDALGNAAGFDPGYVEPPPTDYSAFQP